MLLIRSKFTLKQVGVTFLKLNTVGSTIVRYES